jgi:probable HAF family extracellular repeat protein
MESNQIMYDILSQNNIAGTTRRLLAAAAAAAVIALPTAASAEDHETGDDAPVFLTLDNHGDLNFNQLLGINNKRIIAGYFGDGAVVPNNGYVLVPKNHYAPDNFTHLPAGDTASQTQAIGINDKSFPDIVGFYTDNATGFTHGFLDSNGVQTAVDDPAGLPPNVGTPVQNLLAINDFGKAAGFWTDAKGHEHGYVVQLNTAHLGSSKFTEISPQEFKSDALATQASDITDNDNVCGFWTDAAGNNHGFFGHLGHRLNSFKVTIRGATAVSTSPFGCNNEGEIVGSFTDAAGAVHGFIWSNGRFSQFDAPGSSQTAAFGVSGTFINGINDRGDIVGFYSDGTKVHGFARLAGDE